MKNYITVSATNLSILSCQKLKKQYRDWTGFNSIRQFELFGHVVTVNFLARILICIGQSTA